MAKKKSIVEKFTDTMKGLADTASRALKAEEPPRVDETAAGYVPFAAEGLVSDPTLPIAVQPVRKRATKKAADRRAGRRTGKSSSKSAAKTSARKAAGGKAAKRTARARSKAATRKSTRKTKAMKRGGPEGRKKNR